VRVSRLPESFDLLEFVAAKVVDFFVECQVSTFLSGKLTIIKQSPVASGQSPEKQMQIPPLAVVRLCGLRLARDDLRGIDSKPNRKLLNG
jgi:hypothetical protein